jgi:hypothetical protein
VRQMRPDTLRSSWRVLAAAWVVAGLCSLEMLLQGRHWLKAMKVFVGAWHLGTHLLTLMAPPVAAALIWRNKDAGLFVLAAVAANAIGFWGYYVWIVGSTYSQVLATIALGVLTLGVFLVEALKRALRAD